MSMRNFPSAIIAGLALVPILAALSISSPARADTDFDPIALYGDSVCFDVVRKGSIVGEHKTQFSRVGDDLIVTSRMSLEIHILYIRVYSFDYRSVETWTDGKLRALTARVMDGGEEKKITLTSHGDKFLVSGPEGEETVEGPIFSTNHWHPEAVLETRTLNTLSGRINQVQVTKDDPETLPVAWGTVEAARHTYSGDLHDTWVWYDKNGRWVKMSFEASDGSIIDYISKFCGTGE